jgi:cytidylate kinase
LALSFQNFERHAAPVFLHDRQIDPCQRELLQQRDFIVAAKIIA